MGAGVQELKHAANSIVRADVLPCSETCYHAQRKCYHPKEKCYHQPKSNTW